MLNIAQIEKEVKAKRPNKLRVALLKNTKNPQVVWLGEFYTEPKPGYSDVILRSGKFCKHVREAIQFAIDNGAEFFRVEVLN